MLSVLEVFAMFEGDPAMVAEYTNCMISNLGMLLALPGVSEQAVIMVNQTTQLACITETLSGIGIL